MSILILMTYPIFSHIFIIFGHPEWVAVYFFIICTLFLIKEIVTKNYFLAMLIMTLLVVGAILILKGQVVKFMYLPPILISLGLFILFGASLQKERIPLITRYAQLIDGELSQEIQTYTKRVTQIWTALFLAILIESIILGIFFSVEIWSLFTNLLNYLLIVFVFCAEYIYRNKVYPELPRRNFAEFLQKIIQIRPSQLRI